LLRRLSVEEQRLQFAVGEGVEVAVAQRRALSGGGALAAGREKSHDGRGLFREGKLL
jgi:hypothetical protein